MDMPPLSGPLIHPPLLFYSILKLKNCSSKQQSQSHIIIIIIIILDSEIFYYFSELNLFLYFYKSSKRLKEYSFYRYF